MSNEMDKLLTILQEQATTTHKLPQKLQLTDRLQQQLLHMWRQAGLSVIAFPIKPGTEAVSRSVLSGVLKKAGYDGNLGQLYDVFISEQGRRVADPVLVTTNELAFDRKIAAFIAAHPQCGTILRYDSRLLRYRSQFTEPIELQHKLAFLDALEHVERVHPGHEISLKRLSYLIYGVSHQLTDSGILAALANMLLDWAVATNRLAYFDDVAMYKQRNYVQYPGVTYELFRLVGVIAPNTNSQLNNLMVNGRLIDDHGILSNRQWLTADISVPGDELIVFENTGLAEELMTIFPRRAILATGGELSLVIAHRLRLLSEHGVRISYFGDYEANGINMAQMFKDNVPTAELMYSVAEYESFVSDAGPNLQAKGWGREPDDPTLRKLRQVMIKNGHAVEQEALFASVVAKLNRD